ncbi:hypothetical protein ACFU44_05120 [Nocardia rhizosphaerihabitans]|uniref:hypothetical protein n=1 Tax=Nocardia rhizosphaerihabitans TaxID=1691570 RepID=UPI003671DBFE
MSGKFRAAAAAFAVAPVIALGSGVAAADPAPAPAPVPVSAVEEAQPVFNSMLFPFNFVICVPAIFSGLAAYFFCVA